ncbi:MAG: 1-deoxy-D-xylulose-5-phosphate reductoisomerase [Alphaproteobacteria bacterium]|nr:1-deoxy-D-xylulose-5-phosphate reductoisomerase [Alphaproteobacteria bacterium]
MSTRLAPAPGRPRPVTVLGSTGSVGRSTIDLIQRSPELFPVEALVARRSVEMLADQARRVRARLAVVEDEGCYAALKDALAGSGVEVAAGRAAAIEAAERPAEWVMAAIVGMAGLASTLAAARRGAIVALANKEALVCAGHLLLDAVRRSGGVLLPVDSEHNAIFQVLDATQPDAVERLVLTASGGPFRERSLAEMASATPEQAIAHPNWRMGAKISVDSATLMNKGLELIEARLLFDVTAERIEIVIHPQSVIHSMVEYRDGSVLAQLGSPDMRIPIAHALGWPRRLATPAARLDFAALASLTFERPDGDRFPALALCRAALGAGGAAPLVLNAANEVAVAAFLERRIGFLDIVRIGESVVSTMAGEAAPGDVGELAALDGRARQRANSACQK